MVIGFALWAVLFHSHVPTGPGQELVSTAIETQTADEKKHEADLRSDVDLGKKYSVEVEKDLKLSKNAETLARIQRIGADIAKIANTHKVKASWGDTRLNHFNYTFKLVEGTDVNAFSLPGGTVYIYEGLVKYAESDDELAGVIAHEISHASFRHIATLRREQGKLEAITLPLILISVLTGAQGLGLAGQLGSQAIASGWSVKAEEAADYGGFQYMQESKYNPVGILTFMERLAHDDAHSERADLGIFRTHPPSRERAEKFISRLTEANIPIKRSQVTTSFRSQIKTGDKGVELWFGTIRLHTFAGTDALKRADDAADMVNDLMDSVPRLYDVQLQEDRIIVGRGKNLFYIAEEDARKLGLSSAQMAAKALSAIKQAAYNVAYRVWEGPS